MQKIATNVFIFASIIFGITGIILVLTSPGPDQNDTVFMMILIRILFTSVFIILPSFALSIASKYLTK